MTFGVVARDLVGASVSTLEIYLYIDLFCCSGSFATVMITVL